MEVTLHVNPHSFTVWSVFNYTSHHPKVVPSPFVIHTISRWVGERDSLFPTPVLLSELRWALSAAWQLLPIMKALLISVSGNGKPGCGHCMAIPSVQMTYIDSYLLPICP